MDTTKNWLDFIVIGAQKSGTTSLFQHLRHHPEIFLPNTKELPYFSHDPAVLKVEWSSYMNKFARSVPGGKGRIFADPSLKWGTVTPQYAIGGVWATIAGRTDECDYDEHTVPRRIREQLPDVKLIAVLRDPVERALSHHRMLVRRAAERRTFDEVVARLLAPDALEGARRDPQENTGYIVWGEYARILSGYFDVFSREQLLVVFTDELEHTPELLLRRVQGFIGVSTEFRPDNLDERYNVAKAVRGFLWNDPATWVSPSSPISPQGMRRSFSRIRPARAAWRRLPRTRQSRPRTLLRTNRRTHSWLEPPPSRERSEGQLTPQRRDAAATARALCRRRRAARSVVGDDSALACRLRERPESALTTPVTARRAGSGPPSPGAARLRQPVGDRTVLCELGPRDRPLSRHREIA